MWQYILGAIGTIGTIGGAVVVLFTLFPDLKETIYNWFKKRHWHNCLHSSEKINEYVSKIDFKDLGRTKQLDGKNLIDKYKEDVHEFTILDFDGNKRTIQIPYMEIINFNKHPNTQINISCSEEDPLFLNKEYKLSEDIESATHNSLDMVLKNNPETNDDPHTRLASLKQIEEDKYECVLEKTFYYTQIRTNLSMDYRFKINEYRKTMRNLEQERHLLEEEEWKKNGIPYDALHPHCLTSLENSLLANVIGVSAIWCMEDENDEEPVFYLMPRNKKVGVYKNKLGMPSGDIEIPHYPMKTEEEQNHFREKSLIEFLKWEIAREFAEETGIADRSKALKDYSEEITKNINRNKKNGEKKITDKEFIKHYTDMEIIPLALTREMIRGGKPQMFFLIKTKKIPQNVLEKCFRSSLGIKEFDNPPKLWSWTTATISAEVACNYLYAMEHIQESKDGIISLR